MNKAVPMLRIFDEAKAKAFYVDFLGFEVDWEHRFQPGGPIYFQVRRDEVLFHLTEHHGDGTPGSHVFVNMAGVDEFHQELLSRDDGHHHVPAIADMEWGVRSFVMIDPFNNRISFNQYLR
jgi:catechol 2,3-dioxygenase-like lactoylglutathione lyase family enzyme